MVLYRVWQETEWKQGWSYLLIIGHNLNLTDYRSKIKILHENVTNYSWHTENQYTNVCIMHEILITYELQNIITSHLGITFPFRINLPVTELSHQHQSTHWEGYII